MLVIVILLARRFITAILMMFDQHSDSISIAIFIRSIYYIIIFILLLLNLIIFIYIYYIQYCDELHLLSKLPGSSLI